MAFDLTACYGFGNGANFTDYEVQKGEVFDDFNSYALITGISGNIITIDIEKAFFGQFGKFLAGETLLLHASSSPTLKTEKLGKFICAKIDIANSETLTLDKDISATFSAGDLLDYKIQAVSFAEFHCLKVNSGGIITPQIYSGTAYHGGILAVKVSDKLTLDGYIDLTDKGISTFQKDYLRPLNDQEINGTLDSDTLAGEENFCNNNIFPLNAGDGAAFIFAKNITADKDARIGNPSTHGKLGCRGAADSAFKPSNVTNVGGSSIFICVDKKILYPVTLAKYRTSTDSDARRGKGLARCYIATQRLHLGDDKLLHHDFISDYARLSRDFKLTNFGSGKFRNCDNPTFNLNAFQLCNRLSDNKAIILLKKQNALATITARTKCLVLDVIPKLNEITAVDGDILTFKFKLDSEEISRFITVPEFDNFTLTQDFNITDYFAIFVKNQCTINAKINANSFIFANKLEVGNNAWLGDKVLVAFNQLSGNISDATPKGSLIFEQLNL